MQQLEIVIVYSIFLGFLIYFLLLFVFYFNGFKSAIKPQFNSTPKGFSILIPFRNEAENLEALIHSLSHINYPENAFEIIFINDHSNDNSKTIIEKFLANSPRLNGHLIDIPDDFFGKKAAISEGLKKSNYDLIAQTDADCVVSPNWLFEANEIFEDKNVKLLLGFLDYKSKFNALGVFQILENLALQSIAFSSVNFKIPCLANGANFMFRKDAFNQIQHERNDLKVASGDDMFVLFAILKTFGADSIFFNSNADFKVLSNTSISLKELIFQKIRWSSKSVYYDNFFAKFLALLVLFVNFFTAFLLALAIFKNQYLGITMVVFLLKMCLETLLIIRTASIFNKLKYLLFVFPFSVIYCFYVPIIALLGLFLKPKWKGRS